MISMLTGLNELGTEGRFFVIGVKGRPRFIGFMLMQTFAVRA